MRGRFFGRTEGAGLALGAALLMAGCASPTVQQGQPSKAGLTSIDGATVSLALAVAAPGAFVAGAPAGVVGTVDGVAGAAVSLLTCGTDGCRR